MSFGDKDRDSEPEYIYRCDFCSVECRHDHEGNGCHSCGRGSMRRQLKY